MTSELPKKQARYQVYNNFVVELDSTKQNNHEIQLVLGLAAFTNSNNVKTTKSSKLEITYFTEFLFQTYITDHEVLQMIFINHARSGLRNASRVAGVGF